MNKAYQIPVLWVKIQQAVGTRPEFLYQSWSARQDGRKDSVPEMEIQLGPALPVR